MSTFKDHAFADIIDVVERHPDRQNGMGLMYTDKDIALIRAKPNVQLPLKPLWRDFGGDVPKNEIARRMPEAAARIHEGGKTSGMQGPPEILLLSFCTLAYALCDLNRTIEVGLEDDLRRRDFGCLQPNMFAGEQKDIPKAAAEFFDGMLHVLGADAKRMKMYVLIKPEKPGLHIGSG